MATQFSDLYEQFLSRKVKDTNFISSFTPDFLSEFLFNLVNEGRQMLRDVIVEVATSSNNKMEDIVDSQRETYEYTFTGTSNTTVLSPTPPSSPNFYITVNDVVWSSDDFSFNSGNSELTINNAPSTGTNSVSVGAYTDGQFNNTLNLTEIGLVLDFMQLAYIDTQLTDEKLLNQRVFGNDYGLHSQANHIKALASDYDEKYKRLYQRVNLYTYRQDPDDLSGLGGAS